MTVIDILFPVCWASCWFAAAYHLQALRKGRGSQAILALALGLMFLGASFLAIAPAVYTHLDAMLGVANVMRLVGHVSIVAFSACTSIMLLYWTYPVEQASPRARRRLIGYSTALLLLVALFVAADTDQEAVDWTVRYSREPLVALYLAVYLLSFGLAMAETSVLSRRYARFLPPGPLRTGLRINSTGTAVAFTYCLYKGLYVAGTAVDTSLPARVGWLGREDVISPYLSIVGALLMVVGLTLPTWGATAVAIHGRISALRAYRALYPLWCDLHRAHPQILFGELPPPWPRRYVRSGLQRRVIEIPDGMLRLTGFYDHRVHEQATAAGRGAGLDGDELQAVVDAALVAVALRAHASGRRPDRVASPPVAEAATLEDQVRWLRMLASAYRSRLVVTLVAQCAEEQAGAPV